MDEIFLEDVHEFARNFPLASKLAGSTFIITGVTGLVGSALAKCLLALHKDIKLICPIRNSDKAEKIFGNLYSNITFVECGLVEFFQKLSLHCDYIVHCASPTLGSYMVAHPVETYELAINSTQVLLKYAQRQTIKGIVYVSSLEYYGQNDSDKKINEEFEGHIDYSNERSCYPVGKRAAEYLCFSYAKEYGINVKVARLTQTFGAGVSLDDNRVFAQMARCILAKTDIILHTKGESSKPYCYITDSVSAILYILLNGKMGEAYNVANEDTYVSVREMAENVCAYFDSAICVKYDFNPGCGFAPVTKLNLDTEKLQKIGWKPSKGLMEMFDRMIKSMLQRQKTK